MATTHPSGVPLGGDNGKQLQLDIDQITRMELDLIAKAQAVFTRYDLNQNIHGVFSLDDLENKLEQDLCNHIGLGVGFHHIEPTAVTADPKAPLNVGRGVAVKMLDYFFMVVMAVPTGDQCEERHIATKVFTALRFDIMGSTVAGDSTQRTWDLVREFPNVEQSTDTMLYYSQVWRLAMPNVGNRQPSI